jgi:hypothetical protein
MPDQLWEAAMTRFRINGRDASVDSDGDTPLRWVIH